MVLPGNHEVEVPAAPLLLSNSVPLMKPFVNYKHRFPMPGVEQERYETQ